MGVTLPTAMTDLDLGFTTADPVAATIVILLTLLLIYGVKESAMFNLVLTIFTLFIILLVDFAGLKKVGNSLISRNTLCRYSQLESFFAVWRSRYFQWCFSGIFFLHWI